MTDFPPWANAFYRMEWKVQEYQRALELQRRAEAEKAAVPDIRSAFAHAGQIDIV